jgi:oligopeptide/dipeptide ABC transporter ATP-binding protein
MPILRIRDLRVEYDGPKGVIRAVDGVSFDLREGEIYALVGESGCGKTATALSILRLVEPGRIIAGMVEYKGRDLLTLSDREMQSVRGGEIGMVFQEAAAALNPVMKVGAQVSEAIRIHRKMNRKEAWAEAVRLLGIVALPDPARQAGSYPHELSGGMKQRVMIAIALSCSPSLIIADEPTTALDVTIQAQILSLLRDLRDRMGLTVLLVTHDLGVVAENAHRVGVMYAGRLVEEGEVRQLYRNPAHPYTRGLLAARPMPGERETGPAARLPVLDGTVPDPSGYPPGCRFHPRCPDRMDRCGDEIPISIEIGPGRRVACFLHDGEGGGG